MHCFFSKFSSERYFIIKILLLNRFLRIWYEKLRVREIEWAPICWWTMPTMAGSVVSHVCCSRLAACLSGCAAQETGITREAGTWTQELWYGQRCPQSWLNCLGQISAPILFLNSFYHIIRISCGIYFTCLSGLIIFCPTFLY